MRILIIDVNCKQNSTGKIVYDLYTEFKDKGHTAAIGYGRGAIVDEPNIYKYNNSIGVYLHALRTRLTGYVGYGSKCATKRLIKYIEEFNPDIVHIHTIHGYHVDMYNLLSYLKDKDFKVIYTLHDTCTHTGKCGHTFDCERWLHGCGNCPQLKVYPKSLFFDRTSAEFKIKQNIFLDFKNIVFVSVSKWLGDQAQRSLILRDKQFDVIHNGLDTSIFKLTCIDNIKKRHKLTNEKVFLHVTPNFDDPLKGGKYVLDFASKLINENIKVFIIGNKDPIENAPDNVITIGRTENQSELAAYYSMADVFLLTSSKETFSMVCAESLCCGTPIIGFEAGAPSEIAPEGYGIFVPYGDTNALVNLARSIIYGKVKFKSKEECARFGKANFDKSIMAEKYSKLYETIINDYKNNDMSNL